MTSKMSYETIKRLAKEQGVSVTDLIVLAPKNDPFYRGTKGDVEKAQWFADLWGRFGYTSGVHLRRVHYQLVSQDPPLLRPDGKPYENTERDWDYLGLASLCARYLGLVDPGDFVDRRNPDPIIHAHYWDWEDPTPTYRVAEVWGGFDIEMPEFPSLPGFKVGGYTEGNLQPYHIEVWVEKSTMNDVLIPLCSRYGVNLVTGVGEMSVTAALALVRRVKRADRPCRIFYVSDFDPAGYGMPVSVARKVEFFLQDRGLDLDIRLEPVALTRDQVRAYNLPRTPIKDTELRKGAFEDVHGEGAVELDALEALHPGALAGIVREAILGYYDTQIERKAREQREALEEALEDTRSDALEDLGPEIEKLQAEFDAAVSSFEEAIAGLRDRLGALRREILDRLEAVEVDLDDYPLPDPRTVAEGNGVLFDSTRDYFDQLGYYKARRNGNGCG